MHPLKNILFPSILNRIDMHKVAKLIMLRDVLKLNHDVYGACTIERYQAVRKIGPFFKLPFHLDFLVLFKGDVLSLNRVTKHLVLTTDLDFSDAGRLSKLAKLHLVGKRLVDDRRRTVVGNLNFSLLNHILLLFCFVRKIIK